MGVGIGLGTRIGRGIESGKKWGRKKGVNMSNFVSIHGYLLLPTTKRRQ